MRIALVSEHASPLAVLGGVDAGGQNVHVAALATHLARRGHEVAVYTRRDDPALADRVPFAPGVHVVPVTAGPAEGIPKDELLPHMAEFADRLADDWALRRPDVVHGHFWMSGLAALDAAGRLPHPVPVLQTFHALGVVKRRHQGADDTSPAEREQLEPRVAREVDRVIATCSDEAFELRGLGVTGDRISIVPCGVDIEALSPDGPAEPRGRAHRLVSLGRLVPRKGVDLVIRALASLVAAGFDAELVVAGGGPVDADPEVARLRAVAEDAGVADRVVFRGAVDRAAVPALLRSADAVVCTPWYEPFGIVPLEAMACGVPVVGAAVGGLIDSIADGTTGLLVPPRDSEALADALGRLLADPGWGARLGHAGRARARRRFAWERVADRTLGVYASVLQDAAAEAVATTRRR